MRQRHQSKIKNLAAAPPEEKRINSDGETVIVKKSPLPGIKMVKPNGKICSLALANGHTAPANATYGPLKYQQKLEQGFLPVSECPVASGRMEADKQGPCKEARKRTEPCPHLRKIIAARKAKHREKSQQMARKLSQGGGDLVKQLERLNAQLSKSEQAAAKMPRG